MAVNQVAVRSPIAAAMGASISITGPERGTYLVIGRGDSVESPVMSAGGEVVLRLNGRKMLVTLPFSGYLLLKGNYQVSHIGPVTIDTKRLAKLAETMAKARSPVTDNAG